MLDTETRIVKEYNDYIKNISIFGDTIEVLPSAPQSFTKFPTIIVREMRNTQSVANTSTNFHEHADNLTYQVDIYTKNLNLGNVKYQARNVTSELVLLTCDFFMRCGFIRTSGTRNDYVDITVNRYTMLFQTTKNNWNGKLR